MHVLIVESCIYIFVSVLLRTIYPSYYLPLTYLYLDYEIIEAVCSKGSIRHLRKIELLLL